MKKLLCLWLILGYGFSYAQHVDETSAAAIAANFFNSQSITSGRFSKPELVYAETIRANTQAAKSDTYFYVYNATAADGFVIVSGDERVHPVLAYSDTRDFDPTNIPPNVAKWLEYYKNQIRTVTRVAKVSEKIKQEWIDLKQGRGLISKGARTKSVSPLLQTRWNQSPFYNALAPGNSVTGCVATAMAQVMKYWNYPEHGSGFHSYNHPRYGTLAANFGATAYDWNSMPNDVESDNAAVATLMYHAGISVDMDFSPESSGAYVIADKSPVTNCAEYALEAYFGYKTDLHGVERDNFTDTQWTNLLIDELDASRPILYAGFGSGGGHAFVCDGYDNNSFFHFNWGWGGLFDGYFSIDALDPEGTGIGGGTGGFNSGHQAIIGIEPPAETLNFTLQLNNYLSASETTISYGQAFSLSTNIINNGTATFTGDYGAGIFDNANNFIGFVSTFEQVTLQSGFTYQNDLVFSTDGNLSMLPGTYRLAIYFRPTGGDWVPVSNNGGFNNFVQIKVINSNAISLNSEISIAEGVTLTQGEPVEVHVNIVNEGANDFIGTYDVSLYNLDGTFATTIGSYEENDGLPSGYTYNNPLTFSTSALDATPGTYLLAVQHFTEANGWELTGSDYFQNPVTVTVIASPIQPDAFEENDEVQNAFELPITFNGSGATIVSTGSNCHTGEDYDYYKIELPDGATYSVTGRLHDSYNSGDGNVYSLDALVSYSTDGENWSEAYDDIIDTELEVEGAQTIYFHVAPYFAGETGTYVLELDIERSLLTEAESDLMRSVKVYPNPAHETAFVDISLVGESVQSVNLTNLNGRVLSSVHVNPGETAVSIPVETVSPGFYFVRIKTNTGTITKKLIVTK